MSNPEYRQFIIGGEVSEEDWLLSLQLLGKLGITAVEVSESGTVVENETVDMETIPPGTIPYTFDEITSLDQYLSNEHLGDYWQKYLRESIKPSTRSYCLKWGLNMLAHPTPKDKDYQLSEPQRAKYAEELGLKVVRPRSRVGFSDEYSPRAYGQWNHEEYGDSVIEVGSFIEAVRRIEDTPLSKRPDGINAQTLRFFLALADELDARINGTE